MGMLSSTINRIEHMFINIFFSIWPQKNPANIDFLKYLHLFLFFPDPIHTESSDDVVGFLCGAPPNHNPFLPADLPVALDPIANLLALDYWFILLECCFDKGSHGRYAIGIKSCLHLWPMWQHSRAAFSDIVSKSLIISDNHPFLFKLDLRKRAGWGCWAKMTFWDAWCVEIWMR